MPIDLDDPYSIDKNFITSLVADLFGEQFRFSDSMLWLGEHVDEDASQPREFALTQNDAIDIVDVIGEIEGVLFTELSRHEAAWLGGSSTTSWGTADGIPFTYDFEGYSDVVSGWIDNEFGVSRLVVGVVIVIRMDIITPESESGEFFMERFYPIKRFYNEGQAQEYANDLAKLYTITGLNEEQLFMSTPRVDCSEYDANQHQRDWCACVNNILEQFDREMANCFVSPNIWEVIGTGAIAAGGTFTHGKILERAAKKMAGGPGAAIGEPVAAFIAGSSIVAGWQMRACQVRAKSKVRANLRKALNEYSRVKDTDQTFVCPSDLD